MQELRNRLRPLVPQPVIDARRAVIGGVRCAKTEWPLVALKLARLGTLNYHRRGALAKRLLDVHSNIQCAHTHDEMVRIVREVLALPDDRPGCIRRSGLLQGRKHGEVEYRRSRGGPPRRVR